jgi:hypothetical protein
MGASATERTDGAGGENPPANGSDKGGSPGANEQPGGEQPAGTTQGENGLDRGKLSPMLRGMTEEQISETFDTMFTALRRPVEAAPQPTAPPPAPEPELTNEHFRERFDPNSDKFDPMGAVRDITQRNYGPLIEDIGKRANAGMKEGLRRRLPDFDKHEADIDKVLANVPTNQINEALLASTYFSVLGAKEAQRIQTERNKPPTTREPSTKKEVSETPKLTAEEEQVARVMFRGSADPIKDYLDAQDKMEKGYQMRVPGDPPKKEKK